MKRVAKPEEIVGPVVYLASGASSFVTGDDITVCGGMPKCRAVLAQVPCDGACPAG